MSGKLTIRVPNIPGYNTEDDVANTISELKKIGITQINLFKYITDIRKSQKNAGFDGKFKCEVLKNIRIHAANFNGISYQPHSCTHKVCLSGCCPLCDGELDFITREYYKRINYNLS